MKSLTSQAGVTSFRRIAHRERPGARHGRLSLAGGTLGGSAWHAGTVVDVANAGGTLSGVTLGGSLDLNSGTPTVTVTDELTLSGGSIDFRGE